SEPSINWSTAIGHIIVHSPRFVITTATTGPQAGAPFTLTVTVLDSTNLVDGNYKGTIHFSSTDLAGLLPPDYTFTPADNGVHKFSIGATLMTPGKQSISVTDKATGSIKGNVVVIVRLPIALTGPEGSSFSGLVATFSDRDEGAA